MREAELINLYQSQKNYFKTNQNPDSKSIISQLKCLKAEIKANEQLIIKAIHADFKKPEFEVLTTELFVVYKELNLFIKNINSWRKPKNVNSDWLNFPSTDKIYHVPWGNCLIIAPWNYPFQLAITPLIGAIACGNTVILKPSEYAPNTARVLETIISNVFDTKQAAVVQGAVETAQNLLNLKWDYVFFTGSVPIGKIVSQAIAKHMTPHTLELGGKNPCIITKHAHLSIAVKRIIWGKYINAGQTCIAPDYILIDKTLKTEFIKEFKKQIEAFYGENIQKSTDYSRIISDKHFDRLKNFIDTEQVIYGGQNNKSHRFIAPSLIEAPKLDSNIMQEEIFGPLLPIFTFQDLNEVETIINKIDKPLALYAFTTNKAEQNYLIKNFDFGGGVINDCIVHFVNDKLPFGGVGASGLGNYHGKHSFKTFTRQKSIVHRKNYIDIPIKYPPYNKTKLFKKFLSWFR